MKSINEQKQILQDMEHLINKMNAEIELLRNINYRYYLMHGDKIQNGLVSIPENISFHVSIKKDGDVQCEMIDCNKINIESNYQRIKNELRRLS
ncbi:MAG: hypothetical protein ACK50L_02445 [Bacteroidota bacterium]